MPHDLIPPELSLNDTDVDEALDQPAPSDEKESPLLAAMKRAGSALVKAAKRATRKPVLAAMMMAGAALVAPHAKAQLGDCSYAANGFIYASSGCDGNTGPGDLGSPTGNPGNVGAGDPVDVATGNVFLHAVDYTTAGPNPLQFIRYYNSMGQLLNANSLAGTLSAPEITTNVSYRNAPPPSPWRTNYDGFLQFTGSGGSYTQVVAERPNGQQITFTLSGSTWVPPTDQDYTLTQSGSTWTLTDHNDTQESYTDSGSGWGQLNTITTRNGYQQTLSYSGTYSVSVIIDGATSPSTYYPNLLQSVTDSYGRSLSFTYNDNNLISSVSTPDSLVVSYGYTTYGHVGSYTGNAGTLLTSVSYNTSPATSQTYAYDVYTTQSVFPYTLLSVTDENGNTAASWEYDGDGEAVYSQQGGIANGTTFSFGSNSTTVTNALGVADTYYFSDAPNGAFQLTEIHRHPTGSTAEAYAYFSYDANAYLASKTDWNSNVTNYTNNSYGNPTSITEAYGSSVARTTTIAYDGTWVRLPATITTTGLTRGFTYDGSGNPLTMTDTDTTGTSTPYSTNGQTRETQWTWNGTGEMLTAQLPRTDTTVKYTLTWSSGALTSITDPVGNVTSITSSTGGGYPQTIVDPNSVTTTLGWDTRLNLNTVTVDPSGGNYVTTYTHDPANNLTSVERPDGSTLSYTYDTANRLTNITDLPGNTINLTLDALGDVTAMNIKNSSNATTYSRTATFDKLGRKLTDVDANSNTVTYAWDPNSNLTSVTDALSNAWNFTYDALNRLATRQDPSPGGTTTFTLDAHNRLTNVQDANGNSTSYVRDGFSEAIGITSPDTGSTVLRYGKDGDLRQKVFAGGQTANLTYDADDRNLTVSFPSDSTLNISKTYDQSGHGYGKGRLTSATDQAGSDSFTYDKRGNITNESRVITSIGTLATSTSFDANNNVSGITYPSGTAVAYSRDSMGNVTGISATPPGGTATTIASSITQLPFGPVKSLTFGNGVTGTYSFDNAYNATNREDNATAGDITNLTYGYDARNSLHTITDSANAANSQTLTYDALDRLSSATSAAGGYGTYGWTWDAVNNVQTQTINSVVTTASLNSGSNQLASLAVTGGSTTTVDTTSNGNIADFKIGGTAITSFTYNQANQMASATGPLGASATYEFGLAGQRLLKTPSSGYPITYQYGQAAKELLAENDLHSGQTADYIYMDPGRNSRPIGQVDPTSGNVYYTHTDRQGTPQAVTDSGQNVVWSAQYNPFGDTSSFSGTLTTQSLRLPGQYFDPETGNNHNGFRDYAGTLTRYVQSDPLGLGGGMNTYQYVRGNPFKYTDRLGLDTKNGGQCTPGSTDPMCATGPNGGGPGGKQPNCDPKKSVCPVSPGGDLPNISPPQEPGMPDSGWPQPPVPNFNPFPGDNDSPSVPLLPFAPPDPLIDPHFPAIYPKNPTPKWPGPPSKNS